MRPREIDESFTKASFPADVKLEVSRMAIIHMHAKTILRRPYMG